MHIKMLPFTLCESYFNLKFFFFFISIHLVGFVGLVLHTLRKIWTDSLKGSSLMSFIHRINNYLLSPCHVLGTVLGSATDKVPALTELQETDNQAVHQSQPGT